MTTSFADAPGQGPSLRREVDVALSTDVSGYTAGIQQAIASTNQLATAIGGAAQQADSLGKRAGKSLVHFSVGDFASLAGATAVAGRFQSQLSTLAATAAVTGSSMPALKRQISGVFTDFPVWRQQIVQLAQAISNLGVTKPADVGQLTRSYTKLGAATGEDAQGLASGGINLSRQMGTLDPSRIDKYNNALLTLSKNAGVSATAVSEFSQNLAPFARELGLGEAAVLGISTAFQKAGADGAYASNAFNKIAQDISQLTKTGSPDIAKYASFLGKSNEAFKSMSGQEQVTQIFEKIAKGGPQAASFVGDMGGPRMVAAVQRVAQTGDIRGQIAMAQGSSQDTNNLDKGAKAAMAGFDDAVTSIRNAFTELATVIGDPLLGPLTALAKGFSSVVDGLAKFLKMLGPIPAIAGVAAGAVALPAAFGLAHSGLAAGAGLARSALGSNSGWRTVMREGHEVGQKMAGGMSRDEAVAGTTLGKQKLPAHLQALFDQAITSGQNAPAGQQPGLFGRMGSSSWAQAFQAGKTGRRSGTPPPPAPGVGQRIAQRAGQLDMFDTMGNVAAWVMESQTDPMEEQDKAAADRKFARRARGEDVNQGRTGWRRFGRSAFRFPWQAAETLGDVGGAVARGARGMIPDEMPLARTTRAGLTVASGAGRAFGAVASAAGGLASLAAGPVGMAAAIGIPIAAAVVNSIKENAAKKADVSEALTGQAKYDQMLDRTSTNLAKFGAAVDVAADKLSQLKTTPIEQTTGVTGEDIATVNKPGYQLGDPKLREAITASGGNKQIAQAYVQAAAIQAGPLTGDLTTKYKQDLLSTMGVGRRADVEEIMTNLVAASKKPGGIAPSANFGVVGDLAAGQTGEQFKDILGIGVQGIQAGTNNGTGPTGRFNQLANLLNLGSRAVGSGIGQTERVESFANEFAASTGIDAKELQKEIANAAEKQGTVSLYTDKTSGLQESNLFSTPEQAAKAMAIAVGNTTVGKQLMQQGGISLQALMSTAQTGWALPTPEENNQQLESIRRAPGALGGRIAGLGSVSAAIAAPDNPFLGTAAQQQMVTTARAQAGGDTIQAEANLRGLAEKAGGATSSLGALLSAAADAAAGLTNLTAMTMTRPQAAGETGRRYNTLAGIASTDSSAENIKARDTAGEQATQAAGGLLDYGRGLIQRGRDADKSNARAQADNARQIQLTNESYSRATARSEEDSARARYRSQRNFELSQTRASEDYYRNLQRQYQEFAITQGRAEEDYNRQRARTLEDFHLSAERAEADYQRNLTRTMEDFNQQRQRSDDDYYRNREREVTDAARTEARATTDFNQQQARSQADFRQSQQRALADYHTSQARATADFNTTMARQAEDAAESIYDPFTRIQRKGVASAASVVRNLGNQNKAMTKQLTELQQARDMGLSAEAIKTLNLADPKNAQQLDAMIKGFGSNPNLIKQTNAEVGKRIDASKQLTTSQYSKEYTRQQEDFKKSQTRADEDMKKSLGRSESDFTKSMSRSMSDFTKSMSRSRSDLHRSLARSDQDYARSVRRSEQDLRKSLSRSAADFYTGVRRSEQDLATSMTRSATDFATSVTRSEADFSRSINNAAIDFGLAQQRAATDQATALSDMATDFATTEQRAAQDHATALDQMATAYKTQQTRAAEDLKDSFREFTGGFSEMMTEMTSQATGAMATYAPEAAAAYLTAIAQVGQGISMMVNVPGVQVLIGPPASFSNGQSQGNANTQWSNPGGAANNPQYTPGENWTQPGGAANQTGPHAAGGIALRAQTGTIGEAGPEAILPLNSRGEDFMAGLIAKSLAKGITMAISSTDVPTSSTTNTNTISFAGADIQVVAQDPNAMAKALEAQAKLKRLTSPN